MPYRPRIALLAVMMLTALALSVQGCGDDNPTNPGGVGGTKELDSGVIANGGTYSHTFNTLGSYGYHCTIHGTGMAGTVTVSGGGAASASVSIMDNFYSP